MNKQVLGALIAAIGATSAQAADLAARPYTKAPVAVASVYNWTGFYVGGNIGYGWGQDTSPIISFADPGGAVGFAPYFVANNVYPSRKPAGVIGGGQIGYNWQVNSFVLGAVTDFQAADIHSSGTGVVPLSIFISPSTQSLTQKLDYLGTVRGKIGAAFNNVMIYGTGGYAYGHVKSSITFDATPTNPVFFTGTSSSWHSGWAAGVGGEYGVGPWSFGVEYLHYDLGRAAATGFSAPPGLAFPGASLTADQRVAGDIVRASINYRFGGPVVARY
jgi:outer membrane immunogenic protein